MGTASLQNMSRIDSKSKSLAEDLIRPTHVEARLGFRVWLRYSDGAAGEIDLSDLAG